MLLSLARLPDEGRRFEHQYQAGEIETEEYEFSFQQFPLVIGRVDRVGQDLRLRGQLTAVVARPCDRCLQEVVIPLERAFDLYYAPADPLTGKSGETELQPRDLDFAVYEHDEIDLDQLALEQVALSLPTRVLCREDCRGLCAQCGADLNVEKCQCQKPMDPRWQALADLKDQS
jgi:uncharacterized protein